MKFGYVYPGQTFPALYNNLVRAPLFRHKPYPTDFLAVRYGAPRNFTSSRTYGKYLGVRRKGTRNITCGRSGTFS